MSFMMRPLSDALGAEVVGLDASRPIGEADFARIHKAHLDHHVLVFRDQHLTLQQQIDFSRRFGPLDGHPSQCYGARPDPESPGGRGDANINSVR